MKIAHLPKRCSGCFAEIEGYCIVYRQECSIVQEECDEFRVAERTKKMFTVQGKRTIPRKKQKKRGPGVFWQSPFRGKNGKTKDVF